MGLTTENLFPVADCILHKWLNLCPTYTPGMFSHSHSKVESMSLPLEPGQGLTVAFMNIVGQKSGYVTSEAGSEKAVQFQPASLLGHNSQSLAAML